MTPEQSTIHDWVRLIRAEYLEMPGLNLTKPQIQRLWTLEPQVCDAVVDALVDEDFLKKTQRQAYVLGELTAARRSHSVCPTLQGADVVRPLEDACALQSSYDPSSG